MSDSAMSKPVMTISFKIGLTALSVPNAEIPTIG